MKGRRGDPLSILILGDVGDNFGFKSSFIDSIIEGSTGHNCLFDSIDSKILVNGDVGESFGLSSERAFATINGNVGGLFGYFSKNLSGVINGGAELNLGYCSEFLDLSLYGDIQLLNLGDNFPKMYQSKLRVYNKNTLKKIQNRMVKQDIIPKRFERFLGPLLFNIKYNHLSYVDDNNKESLVTLFRRW